MPINPELLRNRSTLSLNPATRQEKSGFEQRRKSSFSRQPSSAKSNEIKVRIILDTRARRDYPSAFTTGEVSCPEDLLSSRTVEWLLSEAQRELGKVPLLGLR